MTGKRMDRMFDPNAIERIRAERVAWEARELADFVKRQPETRPEYRTGSGLPVQRVYTPEDVADTPWSDIGLPGRWPFTRGPYPTQYRGRRWTMRQIAGFGTGEDTNGRFRYLIEQGQTGLSVDFDMPTLMGYDSDDPRSLGEVGREGVAVDTIEDVEALFEGIDLEKISVSMTINPTAWILLAMYIAIANGIAYVEEVTKSGVAVDAFAPRLAFYFVAQADFFEEVAKFRAARRVWARIMKERFGATKAESMRLRFHCQTAAATLTRAQPMNNVVRTALQALSAVLGGAQSLHTNGLDEAYAIPSEEAMKLALRTQQIIADETRVPHVVDPLGGSYYVEAAAAAPALPIHKVHPETEARQVARLRAVRARRDAREVDRLLDRLAG